MSGVTDLAAWLLAQLDEVERSAQYAVQYGRERRMASKAANWALADVAAKRAIIERYQFLTSHGPAVDHTRAMDMTTGAISALRDVLRYLALPYADRDGYDPAWAPDTAP
jgi:hypothetical protein